MRILHIVRNIEYLGGTEKFIIALLGRWKLRYPEDEIILVCTEGVGLKSKALEKENIKTINFPLRWHNIKDIFLLFELIKSIKPQVVHTHLFQADFPGLIAAKLAGIKTISTKYCQFSRTIEKDTKFEKLFTIPVSNGLLESLLNKVTDRIVVVSQQTGRYFQKRGYKRQHIETIPCCHITTDSNFFKIPPSKISKSRKIIIGTVSRLVPGKGIDNLIKIYKSFSVKYPNSKLIIAGNGFLLDDLKQLANNLNVERKIDFLGLVNNVTSILSRINVFLFTSHTEGFPLAIQEAMCAGKTILSTNVGGISELVRNGREGLLYDDGENDLAVKKLISLVENPDRAYKLGKNAKMTMRARYNLDAVMNSIKKLYISLI